MHFPTILHVSLTPPHAVVSDHSPPSFAFHCPLPHILEYCARIHGPKIAASLPSHGEHAAKWSDIQKLPKVFNGPKERDKSQPFCFPSQALREETAKSACATPSPTNKLYPGQSAGKLSQAYRSEISLAQR